MGTTVINYFHWLHQQDPSMLLELIRKLVLSARADAVATSGVN